MSEEKTEQPSPHKLQESRKKGQVAKSNDVATAVMFVAGLVCLNALGKGILSNSAKLIKHNLSSLGQIEFTVNNFSKIIRLPLLTFATVMAPVFLVVIVAAICGHTLQTGLIFSLQSISPSLDKLNPIQGVKRVFSSKGFMETVKVLLRLVLIIVIFKGYLTENLPKILTSPRLSVHNVFFMFGTTITGLFTKMTVLLVVMGGLDYILQRYLFMKDMMMTKQEVKEEFKSQEGDPFLKSRIKAKQREMARMRMMEGVKKAKVVVTNPTHYACALKYDEKEDEAPILVAKGKDYVAQRIKEVAKEYNVPIYENKPLAQLLFKDVEIDEKIPPEMYKAMAEVIAYVETLDMGLGRRKRNGRRS